jgi:hypothetical protein
MSRIKEPTKEDFEIAANAFKQYCDKNIIGIWESFESAKPELETKAPDVINMAEETKSRRIGIYFACSQELPNQSPRRRALQIMVKKSRILNSSLEEYDELDPKWRKKLMIIK